MTTLLVFDEHCVSDRLSGLAEDKILLFPLTGNRTLISRIKSSLHPSPELLDSAAAIYESTSIVRESIAEWSSSLSNIRVSGRTLKKALVLPGSKVSSWWFGPLSEKNTFKSKKFLRLAQIEAVRATMEKNSVDNLIIAVGDGLFKSCLKLLARQQGIQFQVVPVQKHATFRNVLRSCLKRLGMFGQLLRSLYFLFRFFVSGMYSRGKLPPLIQRLPRENDHLILSFFPILDMKAAEKGVFINRFWPALPDSIRQWGMDLSWLLMPISVRGTSFSDTLSLVHKLSSKEERLILTTEFFTFSCLLQSVFFLFRQIPIAILHYSQAKDHALSHLPFSHPAAPLFKELWLESLSGPSSAYGIAHYLIFKKILTLVPPLKDIIYPLEMHHWEKALNAAARTVHPSPRTIGFQHAAISNNYFHFFHTPAETQSTESPEDLPLPTHMALSGDAARDLLAPCKYPGVVLVEALRNLYIEKALSRSDNLPKANRPALLVAGSIDAKEVKSLASIVSQAFPEVDTFDILFKPHPLCPMEPVFEELNIHHASAGYKIIGGDIGSALSKCDAVLVPSSTVSVEALAYGCNVILPVFPDSLFMNPLASFPDYYRMVTSPVQLMEEMKLSLSREFRTPERNFIRSYWRLDSNLPLWQTLLKS